MSDYSATIALFEGDTVLPCSTTDGAHGVRTFPEVVPSSTYRTFTNEEEPFDLHYLLPRWWPVDVSTQG